MERQARLIMVDYKLNQMENSQKDKAFRVGMSIQI